MHDYIEHVQVMSRVRHVRDLTPELQRCPCTAKGSPADRSQAEERWLSTEHTCSGSLSPCLANATELWGNDANGGSQRVATHTNVLKTDLFGRRNMACFLQGAVPFAARMQQ